MAAFERSVLRIDRPEVQQGMTPQHRVRPLMPAAMRGDFAATDPFLALMEDWFPRGVFGKHPHRGIETVTYVLEGRLDHYDNQGHSGVIGPGDVQWMTAGSGLVDGCGVLLSVVVDVADAGQKSCIGWVRLELLDQWSGL